MGSFKYNPVKLFYFAFALLLIGPSCFMPNGYLDRNKKAKCIFFMPGTKEIIKVCNDGNFTVITALAVEIKYDTIKIINGGPMDRFTLFEWNKTVSFPYKIDTLINYKDKEIIIHLKTDKREYSYALSILPADWAKDTLAFEYYYRR
ncbi:hypothetical protein [Ferruginibacter sp. SUN106]|uniref:hypothetical protein n=1 Tax=Ferruginibacter sp. SUN106 TaxID=2978348 RepID=UPI003D35CFF0